MSHTPTEEQLAIIKASKETTDNMIVSALAGAAKTSTLELICKALTGIPTLSLAFNKKIAEEMKLRLPGHVEASTMNSLGHRVWGKAVGKRLTLSTDKNAGLLKAFIETRSKKEQTSLWENFSTLLTTTRIAKASGYIPPQFKEFASKSLDPDFFETLEEILTPLEQEAVDTVIINSISTAFEGYIDFDDQIFMPTLFGGAFPRYKLIMVDEAQDLSPLNHHMLKRLMVGSRLIAVGDPHQAIYGFRGAATNSMGILEAAFNMKSYPLTISFRCPIAVVNHVKDICPTMRYPDWAKPGEVKRLEEWTPADIPDGAAVICRQNAPLFWLAFRLIKSGRGIKLWGSDIGSGLIRVLKKFGPDNMPAEEVLKAIDEWEKEAEKKNRSKRSVKDRAECLRVLAKEGKTLQEIILYANHIFTQSGSIQLMTGHKSKGLEFNNVFHLDSWLCVPRVGLDEEKSQQELNIRYVIETRAMDKLCFIDREGFGG